MEEKKGYPGDPVDVAAEATRTLKKRGMVSPGPSSKDIAQQTIKASATTSASNVESLDLNTKQEEEENCLSSSTAEAPPIKRLKPDSTAAPPEAAVAKTRSASDATTPKTPDIATDATTAESSIENQQPMGSTPTTTEGAAAPASAAVEREQQPRMPSEPSSQLQPQQQEQPENTGGESCLLPSQRQPLPISHVDRTFSSNESIESDLSASASSQATTTPATAGCNHERSTSPTSERAYIVQEVPPAPPSTPASNTGLVAWDTVGTACGSLMKGATDADGEPMTPLPIIRASVQNAYALEQAQRLMEGAATPAPTRQETGTLYDEDAATQPGHKAAAATGNAGTASSSQAPLLPEDFSDWAVGDRYKLIRILGRGSYGEVAQAVDLTMGREDAYVAIKRIQSPFDQEVDAVRLYREIHILRRMRGHDCIIQLLDVVQPPTEDLDDFHDLYLVFEYVDTDLYKLIMSPQYLTTEHIQTFLYQMLAGIKYIHSFSVIHRDLKPANILLNEDCSLKICDFGLARIVDSSSMTKSLPGESTDKEGLLKPTVGLSTVPKLGLTRQLTKHVVTRWYRAPELILIQPYTSAVDIWSLGCILAELLSMQDGNVPGYEDRKPLFPGGTCYPLSGEGDSINNDERLDQLSVIFGVIGTPSEEDVASIGKANEYITSLKKIKNPTPLEKIYPSADPAAIDLLKKMLQFNPKRRCTAGEALEHEFFKGVRRRELEQAAPAPLEGPDFLESNKVDLKVLKQRTYDEVLWYRDQEGAAADYAPKLQVPPPRKTA